MVTEAAVAVSARLQTYPRSWWRKEEETTPLEAQDTTFMGILTSLAGRPIIHEGSIAETAYEIDLSDEDSSLPNRYRLAKTHIVFANAGHTESTSVGLWSNMCDPTQCNTMWGSAPWSENPDEKSPMQALFEWLEGPEG